MFYDPEEMVLQLRTQIPIILKLTSPGTVWNQAGILVGLVALMFSLQLFKPDSSVSVAFPIGLSPWVTTHFRTKGEAEASPCKARSQILLKTAKPPEMGFGVPLKQFATSALLLG